MGEELPFSHIEVDPEVAREEEEENRAAYPEAGPVVVRNLQGKVIRIERPLPGGDSTIHR